MGNSEETRKKLETDRRNLQNNIDQVCGAMEGLLTNLACLSSLLEGTGEKLEPAEKKEPENKAGEIACLKMSIKKLDANNTRLWEEVTGHVMVLQTLIGHIEREEFIQASDFAREITEKLKG